MTGRRPGPRERTSGRRLSAAAGALLLALGPAGCTAGSPPAPPRPWAAPTPAALERPAACRSVPAGPALARVLASAKPGDAFCLAAGDYPGPIGIGPGITVWGPRGAVIRSSGEGTTVRLQGDGASLLGVTVDGSGGRYDLLDAAVHVGAQDARVEGVRVVHAVFGILVEKSRRALLRGNEIQGNPRQALGLRGDGIRLWETYDSRIEANQVLDSRDVVVWYSSGNRIVGNRIERGRYGTHLMYSHRNQIAENAYVGNVTGIFLMYSRDVTVRHNLIAEAAGAAGFGLGLKESGNLQVVGNQFLHDTVGVYADTSPLYLRDRNVFDANVFRYDQVGVIFHSSEERNAFRANDFRDNGVPVRVEGRGDALRVSWAGNYFDDYAGYDLDGDGVGDVPYELRSLSSDLVAERPALAFYRGTPALGLVETIGRVVPLFTPRLLLVDPSPRMAPVAEGSLAD